MTQPDATPQRRVDPPDRRIRRAWVLLSGTYVLLALVIVVRLVLDGAQPVDWAVLGLLGLVGLAAVRHRQAALALESGRRGEAESFARILSGLSRSVSPDAIVRAIVEELGSATGADHVVVVRRRPDAMVLEATLTSTRAGVPDSSTILPIGDLMDRLDTDADTDGATLRGTEPVAIPVLAGPLAGVSAGAGPTAMDVREPVLVGAGAGAGVAGDVAEQAGRNDPIRRATLRKRGGSAWAGFTARVGAGALGTEDADPADPDREPTYEQAVAERIAARVRRTYGLTHTLAAPMSSEHGVIGAIVISRRVADAWPSATRRILGGAALEASTALDRVYSHRAAETRASTDALTGLPNRRYFDEFCGLLARRRRAEDAVGVLMIDIDHFKRLNDGHGHDTGDVVLRAVGGAIMSAVREDDVPARYGGEEFVVLLRNPSGEIAVEVGERVRTAVRELDLRHLGVSKVTVSVGVAVAQLPDEPIADIIKAADRALYRAKRGGRDKVVAA